MFSTLLMALLVLIMLPNFISTVDSEFPLYVSHLKETSFGYLALGSLSSSWGGSENLIFYLIDEYGFVVESKLYEEIFSAVSSCDVQSGILIASNDLESNLLKVAAFSDSGENSWLVSFNELFSTEIFVCASKLDLYIAGNYGFTPKLLKLSGIGQFIWEINLPDSFTVSDVAFFYENIFILGSVTGEDWTTEVYLWKVDSDGNTVNFQNVQQDSGRYNPVAIAVNSEGIFIYENAMTSVNNLIAERVLLKLDFNYANEWINTISESSWERAVELVLLSDGSIVTTGWTNSLTESESNRSNLFITKISSFGTEVWTRYYGTNSTDYGLDISLASDNGFMVTGCHTGDYYTGWILKTDSLGLLSQLGMEDIEREHISAQLLVNPSQNISISVNSNIVQNGIISLYDVSGRLLSQQNCLFQNTQNFYSFNSNNLQTGLFFVKVLTDKDELILSAIVYRE